LIDRPRPYKRRHSALARTALARQFLPGVAGFAGRPLRLAAARNAKLLKSNELSSGMVIATALNGIAGRYGRQDAAAMLTDRSPMYGYLRRP